MRKMTITVRVQDNSCGKMSTETSKEFDIDAILRARDPRMILAYEISQMVNVAADLREGSEL